MVTWPEKVAFVIPPSELCPVIVPLTTRLTAAAAWVSSVTVGGEPDVSFIQPTLLAALMRALSVLK